MAKKSKKLEKKVDKAKRKASSLSKEVKSLRRRVADADTDVAVLKADLETEREKRRKHATRAGRLERKLDKARARVKESERLRVAPPVVPSASEETATSMVEEPDVQPVLEVVPQFGAADPASASVAPDGQSTAGPDESWTVGALRAEAKARGLTGYSRLGKGALLAVLR